MGIRIWTFVRSLNGHAVARPKCNVWLLINEIVISGESNLMYIWSEARAIKVSIDLSSAEDSTGALEP